MAKSITSFVTSCLADAGYAEQPLGSNNTKFGVEFGWNKVAWCAIYGWCKYKAAGVTLPIKSASCVAIYDYCAAHDLHYPGRRCVIGDSVIRGWQGIARTAAGFDPEQTHFQEVLETKTENGVKYLGLWGGNQGAGYVGPSVEWVKADDPTILGGLAFHTLFAAAAPTTPPVHDKGADAKTMPAAKSHPHALSPKDSAAVAQLAQTLPKRRRPLTAKARTRLRLLRSQITQTLTGAAK
ncbi:MAG TPA: hypothetical protein VG899_12470 [Mycobacteriales bacterium]|nr:hypothetical protein [Mycobacteriales bacterium]